MWIFGTTHTCHYWRETALSTPTLWTTIPVTHCLAEVIEAFLERSGAAPLVVDATIDFSQVHYALSARLRVLRQVFHRIERLKVQLPCERYRRLFPRALTATPSPLLQLVIGPPRGAEYYRDRLRSPLAETALIPSQIISSLQHLDVYNYVVQWDPRMFLKTLTTLRLAPHTSAPMSRVVDVISNLMVLQELYLKHAMEPLEALPPPVFNKVILPSLTHLSMHQHFSIETAYHFLEHFQLPSLRKMDVSIGNLSLSDLDTYPRVLNTLLPRAVVPHAPVRCVQMDLAAGQLSMHCSHAHSDPAQVFTFAFKISAEGCHEVELLAGLLCTFFPTSNVEQLEINLPAQENPLSTDLLPLFLYALESMERVHTLSVSATSHTTRGGSGRTPRTVRYPASSRAEYATAGSSYRDYGDSSSGSSFSDDHPTQSVILRISERTPRPEVWTGRSSTVFRTRWSCGGWRGSVLWQR